MASLLYYLEIARQMHPLKTAPKAWNYAKYKCLTRRVTQDVRRYTPQIGGLTLTKRCNLNCTYCSAAKFLTSDRAAWAEYEASLEKVQRIFANPLFANCLLVDLLGGEPLLVNDFDRIIAFLTSRGHLTNTSTNGMLLAARIKDLKLAGISRINVSVYDENRAVLERDLPGINQIFPVHASLVLLRSLVEKQPDKIIETARFIRDSGCRSLRLFMYRPMGINPQPAEVIDDAPPAYLEFRQKMESVLPGFCLWPAAIQAAPYKKRCAQLWQRVGCDVLGNLDICCGIDTSLPGPGSNLFENGPNVIFNHPTMTCMRKQLLDPRSPPPNVCKTCNLLGDPGW